MVATLSPIDYVVCVAVLVISAGIGVYHAILAGRQQTSNEYFLAGRSMHWFPVGVSIAVSVISAIAYIGLSSLSYYAGPGMWVAAISRPIGGLIAATVITPVFYNLKIASVYEYLEKRFNLAVRYIAVSIHFLTTFLILGVVVYAPALALNAVTGLSLVGSILAVGVVCTFYSTVGGIKAVIWSDLFQSLIMLLGLAVITITAIARTGGVSEVWGRAAEGERTSVIFDFRIDPSVQLGFWPSMIGGVFFVLGYGATNQNQAQRFLTCENLRDAKLSAFCGFGLLGVIEFFIVMMGFVLFSYYYGCDPLISGKISNSDQIVPYFIVDTLGSVPGVTGLLISAVFSAALSTFSTAINGMTTVTGESIVKRFWPKLTDTKFTLIMKGVSVIYGSLFMFMAFVASVAGSSLAVIALRIIGLMGPILAAVLLGILVPRANSKGAIVGTIAGLALGVWLLVGSVVFPPPRGASLPLSTELCPANGTVTDNGIDLFDTTAPPPIEDTRAWIYRISFQYLGVVTSVIPFLIGVIVSLATSKQYTGNDSIDAELLSPVLISIYRRLPENWKYKMTLKEGDNTHGVNNVGDIADKKEGETNLGFENSVI